MATQAKRDYYEILGVTRTASTEEIEEAHTKLVVEIRKSGGEAAIDQLLQANRAHTVLTNGGRRARYDRFGTEGPTGFTAKRDHYQVLGISREATGQEIDEAYAKLVLKIRNSGGLTLIDKLIEANRAHAVLVDSVKRLRYDEVGFAEAEETSIEAARATSGVDNDPTGFWEALADVTELFSHIDI